MIEYIKGELTELTPALATLEAAGVGYGLNISLNTYEALTTGNGQRTTDNGQQTSGPHQLPRGGEQGGVHKLYVYEAIREDAHVLFGFADKKERELFELLISVSGVGANTARMVLSSMNVSELCNAISSGNERVIKGIKGIGLKTAQRIIVDLRDKIVALGIADYGQPTTDNGQRTIDKVVKEEAVSALTMLGFSPAPTQKVVVQILQQQPDLPVEQVVKLALKQIK